MVDVSLCFFLIQTFMVPQTSPFCLITVTCVISVRKWKKKSGLGKARKWEFEIGEDIRPVNLDLENITESRGNVSVKALYLALRMIRYCPL